MGAIDWARQNLTPTLTTEQFAAAAEKAPLGSEGLFFTPIYRAPVRRFGMPIYALNYAA